MPGPTPKAADQRHPRAKPLLGGDWVALPSEGRQGRPPRLPSTRKWRKATRDLWAMWWASPQATMWDQSGKTLWRWAELADGIAAGELAMIPASREMRAIEDDHGMSPAAMQRRRWFVVGDEVADRRSSTASTAESSARDRLRSIAQ